MGMEHTTSPAPATSLSQSADPITSVTEQEESVTTTVAAVTTAVAAEQVTTVGGDDDGLSTGKSKSKNPTGLKNKKEAIPTLDDDDPDPVVEPTAVSASPA